MFALIALQQMVVPASGLPQPIPATSFSCSMERSDASRFTIAGTTPAFRAGFDPNGSQPATTTGTGPSTMVGRVTVSPGHASEWFREFQVSSRWSAERFILNLNLRRGGASIATMTRYIESDRHEPYDHYAVGFCTTDFANAQPSERPTQ